MNWGEVIFIILLAGGMLGPTAYYKQWWLFSVFMIFFVIFGLVEWYSVSKTDMSVSQHFWEFSKTHTKSAWGVLVGMFVAWVALLGHLAAKLLKKKED